jgi:hypothetical protein
VEDGKIKAGSKLSPIINSPDDLKGIEHVFDRIRFVK